MPINMTDWADGDLITAARLNQIKNEAASVTEANVFSQPQQAPIGVSGSDTDLVNRKFYWDNMTSGAGGGNVPSGGVAGQVLYKNSGGDYDTLWRTLAAADVGAYSSSTVDALLSGKASSSHTHAIATFSSDGFMSSSDKFKLDDASSTVVNGALISRDASGRAQVSDPSAAQDIATKNYVDTSVGASANQFKEVPLGSVSGSLNADFDTKKDVMVTLTLTGNCTVSFINVPSGVSRVTLLVTQDATGGRTLSFGIAPTWLRGSKSTIDPAANATSYVDMVTLNGGTTWVASVRDTRAQEFDSYFFNPPSNGDNYVIFKNPVKLDCQSASIKKAGTGSVVLARSTNGGSTFSTVTGSAEQFDGGDILRATTSGFSGWFTFTVPRVA